MANLAIKVQASRFSVLKVEDDDDSDEKGATIKQPGTKASQQSATLKKKAKKKKKAEQIKNDTEELQNLAFCKDTKTHLSYSCNVSDSSKGATSGSQWEQWKQIDKENLDREFEKELNDVLLQSRIEYEEIVMVRKAAMMPLTDSGNETRNGERKKNKKKNRPSSASVDCVNKLETSEKRDLLKHQKTYNISLALSHDNHNNDVTETAKPLAMNLQNDREKTVTEKIVSIKEAILQREETIRDLQEVNKLIEAEVVELKMQNQQFCNFLCQGEMMDKTALAAELEKLGQHRDDLTKQVAQCLSELEKERSKGHALKAERDKLKGSKHGGK